MDAEALRNNVSNAIRFWEALRLVYNGTLAAIVIIYFALNFPASKRTATIDGLLLLFLLAVLANVAYCAAYIADVFVQASAYRETWRRARWIVLRLGSRLRQF